MQRRSLIVLMFVVAVSIAAITPTPVPTVTSGVLALFVDPAGNDANRCTATGASACKTIQAAYNKVPKRVAHNVTITGTAGSYAGALVEGFSFENGATLTLDGGTMVTATVTTGTPTGTASSSALGADINNWSTLTDTTQSWTTDDLRGKFVEILAGPCIGTIHTIYGNTATTLTIGWAGAYEGAWGFTPTSCNPTSSSTYVIRTPSLTISSAPTGQVAGLIVNGIQGTLATSPLRFKRIKFTSARAMEFNNSVGFIVLYSMVSGGTSGGYVFRGAQGFIEESVATMTAGSTSYMAMSSAGNAAPTNYVFGLGNIQDGPGSFLGHAGTGGGAYAEGVWTSLFDSSKNAAPSLATVKIEHCVGECEIYGSKFEGVVGNGIQLGQPSGEYSSGGGQVRIHGLTIDGFAGVGIMAIGPWRIMADSTDPILGTGTGASSYGIVLHRGAQMNLPGGANTLAGNQGAVLLDTTVSSGGLGLSYVNITAAKTVCTSVATCIRDSTGASGALDRIEDMLDKATPKAALNQGVFVTHVKYKYPYVIDSMSMYVTGISGGGAGNTVIECSDGTNKCDCTLPCAGGANVGSANVGIVKSVTCTAAAGNGCAQPAAANTVCTVLTAGCTTTQPTADQVNTYGFKW